MRTRIKFCGCTSANDADAAVAAGADAVGVIFATVSPRRVSSGVAREIARFVPPFVSLVGVFVDPARAHVEEARAAGFMPQFSGNEAASACISAANGGPFIKVFHLRPDDADILEPNAFELALSPYTGATPMFDTVVGAQRGGTGRSFEWSLAGAVARRRRVIISGGLTPENVGDCIRLVRPYGVDVRSGIESNGVKDADKMRAFVRAVKEADAQT